MFSLLRQELSWLIGTLVVGGIFGLIIGYPALTMLVFCFAYACWLLWRMANIVQWLNDGARKRKAPPTTGLMNEVVSLIHRQKIYSGNQKNRYRTALARFNSLAAVLPDATLLVDQYNNIQWSNSAALALLNINAERDHGQRIDNLIRTPDFQNFWNHSDVKHEVEIASPIEPDRTLSLIKVAAGKSMRVLIVRDISQRVKVRNMRKAFVADVSHELRTPLTVIRGYLELLLDEKTADPRSLNALTNINKQSERMQQIVEHLLELSKLEGNPLREDEGEPIMVASLLQTIVRGLQDAAASNHVFVLDVDNDLLLLGSENEVYSAASNLIANAINYTDPGTTITVAWHVDINGDPLMSVSDNGPGIEAQHLSRLSERFYRVDVGRSRDQGGTGLGLAIVKHSAHRHGGELIIDSQPGIGSTFCVSFPATRIARNAKVVNL